MGRQIQNITSKNLDVRLDPQTVPIELEQLVLSFNHIMSVLRMSLPASPISQRISLTKLARRLPISSRKRKSPSASLAARKELEDVLSYLISKS
ncbi:hypothetical protein ACNKHX_02860 [Shigella flexneri]